MTQLMAHRNPLESALLINNKNTLQTVIGLSHGFGAARVGPTETSKAIGNEKS